MSKEGGGARYQTSKKEERARGQEGVEMSKEEESRARRRAGDQQMEGGVTGPNQGGGAKSILVILHCHRYVKKDVSVIIPSMLKKAHLNLPRSMSIYYMFWLYIDK